MNLIQVSMIHSRIVLSFLSIEVDPSTFHGIRLPFMIYIGLESPVVSSERLIHTFFQGVHAFSVHSDWQWIAIFLFDYAWHCSNIGCRYGIESLGEPYTYEPLLPYSFCIPVGEFFPCFPLHQKE